MFAHGEDGQAPSNWRYAWYVGPRVLTLVIIGVGVAAAVGFVVLLRWPASESVAESGEDRQGDPPITDVFSQSGG
jgi:hypothetical protein